MSPSDVSAAAAPRDGVAPGPREGPHSGRTIAAIHCVIYPSSRSVPPLALHFSGGAGVHARGLAARALLAGAPARADGVNFVACGGGGSGTGTASGTGGVAPSAQVTTYAYDAAGRLVSALVGTDRGAPDKPQLTNGYGAAGNPTCITAAGQTRALSYTVTNSIASGAYDADGSPTSLDGARYRWDAAGRVVSAVRGNQELDFTYDGFGRLARVVTLQSGRVTSDRAYTWCGAARCLERDNLQSGSSVSKRYYDQGVVDAGQGYYYVQDRLGSVRQLVDAAGTVRAQYDYDPYGNTTKRAGDADSDVGYAGYFRPAQQPLQFALHRAYDPENGRWLNRDPIGEMGGVDVYGYVGGNPVKGNDPSGHRNHQSRGLDDGRQRGVDPGVHRRRTSRSTWRPRSPRRASSIRRTPAKYTVFAEEISQIMKAGYPWVGDFLIPP